MSFDKDIFEEIDKMFREEMKRIRKFITELSRSFTEVSDFEKRREPIVFGFSYRWHSGMEKPEIKFFGNVKPAHPYGVKISEEATPLYDIFDRGDHYEIVVEVAGARKEDIDIELKNGDLYISAKTPYKKYTLSIRMPADLDVDKMRAKLNNGILVLTAPKTTKESGKRRLNIESD